MSRFVGTRERKLIQPAFVKTRVQSYAPVMAELTKQMLDSWSPGKSVPIDFEFETLTSKIALKTLFDLDDLGDRERFSKTLRLEFDLMNARLRRLFKLPLWVPTPANRRLQRALAELDQTVQGFIASGRSRQRPGGDDLLSRLLLAQHEDARAAIILAAVGQRYRFTLDPDAVIGIKPQITLLPANGIPATLERRFTPKWGNRQMELPSCPS